MKNKTSMVGAAACLFAIPVCAPAAEDALTDVVVTATRAGDGVRADLLGASFTVIGPKDMEERQIRIVSDVLRDVPGVAVNRTGGVGGMTQVRMRGAEGNHTLVLIDGIKASDPYYGEFDFATLTADDVAKVEVLRGQQSALYGSDAIGGVVNYITLTGQEAPGTRLRVEGGSFGTVDASARTAGVSGPLDYSLSAGYQSTDGTPTSRFGDRDLASDNTLASAKLIYSPSDEARIKAVVRYSHTEADTNEQPFSGPFAGYAMDGDGYYTNRALYALVRGELDVLDGRWSHALSAQGVDSERRAYSSGALEFGNNGERQRYSYESTLRFGSESFAQRITAAYDYEREELQNRSLFLSDAQAQQRTATTKGLVAQYDASISEHIGLGAALRHDSNDRFEDATTYRLQASYRLDSGTRLHAAAGTGVKNPGYFELFGFDPDSFQGNPNLKPEKSRGWEAGVEQAFAGGRAKIDVTYFNSRLRDEISFTLTPDFLSTYENLDFDSKQTGVEIALAARVNDTWRIDASYTYLDAKQGGEEEVRRPPHAGSLNVAWRGLADRRLGAALTVRYNGSMLDNDFRTFTSPPVRLSSFTLVNLGGDFRVSDALQVYARVENLLDEDYEEVFTFRTPGRGAYAGARFSF